MAIYLEWDGKRYRRYPESPHRNHRVYWQRRTPDGVRYLHRDVWERFHGAIPDGYVVHHRDEDPLNNDVSNLVAVPRGFHQAEHMDEERRALAARSISAARESARAWHQSEAGRAWHREHGKRTWVGRAQVAKTCEVCGKEYTTPKGREGISRFCHLNCKMAAFRARRRSRAV